MNTINIAVILSLILFVNYKSLAQKHLDIELDDGSIYTENPTGGNGSKFVGLVIHSGINHDSRSHILFRHGDATYASIISSYSQTLAAAGLKIRTHSENSDIIFSPNSTNRMTILANNGYVGIGTLNPAANLSVVGIVRGAYDDTEAEYTEFGHGGNNGYINTKGDGRLDFRDDGSTKMSLTDAGFLGLGTTSPEAQLHVHTSTFTSGAGEVALRVGGKGDVAIDASGVIGGRLLIKENGEVGIGTTNPNGYKLAVKGNIGAEEIEVRTNYWADFVFDKDYQLRPLKELEVFIQQYGHLPDIPSEEEAVSTPLNLGEMDVKLLQKIEELTLYTIEQEKKIEEQQKIIEEMYHEIQLLKNKYND